MKKAWAVAFSLVGTLVGVGFVSGREIYSFYARFGIFGLISAAVSSAIFGLVVFMFLVKNQAKRTRKIDEKSSNNGVSEGGLKRNAVAGDEGIKRGANLGKSCLENYVVVGENNLKNGVNSVSKIGVMGSAKPLKFLNIKGVVNTVLFELCSLVVMAAMIAGVFDLSANFLGESIIFSCFCIGLAFVFVAVGKTALDKINRVFIPLVIVFVLVNLAFCVFEKPCYGGGFEFRFDEVSAIGFGLMYVGMNILTVMPIASIFAGDLETNKQRRAVAVIFGAMVLVLLVVIGLCLMVFGDGRSSMPLLKLAQTNANWLGLCFKIIIAFGLLTTLVASGVVIKNRINTKIKNNLTSTLLAFILAMALSLIGFVKIIDIVYPVIGVLGIGYIISEVIEFCVLKKRKINIKM